MCERALRNTAAQYPMVVAVSSVIDQQPCLPATTQTTVVILEAEILSMDNSGSAMSRGITEDSVKIAGVVEAA